MINILRSEDRIKLVRGAHIRAKPHKRISNWKPGHFTQMHFYCFERLGWWLESWAHKKQLWTHSGEHDWMFHGVWLWSWRVTYVRSRLFYTHQSCPPVFLHIQVWHTTRHSCCVLLLKPEHEGDTNTAIQLYRIKFASFHTFFLCLSLLPWSLTLRRFAFLPSRRCGWRVHGRIACATWWWCTPAGGKTQKRTSCWELTSPTKTGEENTGGRVGPWFAHVLLSLRTLFSFPLSSKSCSIGMVLPLWSDTKIHLDGDGWVQTVTSPLLHTRIQSWWKTMRRWGNDQQLCLHHRGFTVNTAGRTHVFKPVSVQVMWWVMNKSWIRRFTFVWTLLTMTHTSRCTVHMLLLFLHTVCVLPL